MSWWTKNRKKVLLGGLLGGAGLGVAGVGPLAGLLSGAGEAGGALAAANAAGAVGAMGPVASGVEYGALLGGTNPMMASAMGMGDKFMTGLGGASKAMGAANAAMQPPPQPAPPPMMQQQQIQQPVNAGYQGGNLPPELQGLSESDPRVIEWKRKQGAGYV